MFQVSQKKPLSQPAAASSPFRGAYSYRFSTGTSFGHPFRGGFFHQQNSPGGVTGGLSAVTLPFLHLKLGRKVSGDSPPAKGYDNYDYCF